MPMYYFYSHEMGKPGAYHADNDLQARLRKPVSADVVYRDKEKSNPVDPFKIIYDSKEK